MKIVIDIPKERFRDIQRIASVQLDSNYFKTAEQIIANGVPYEERPQGEWIKITREGTVPVEYVCSCCGRKIYDDYERSIPMSVFYPYCHCGADMRGEEE